MELPICTRQLHPLSIKTLSRKYLALCCMRSSCSSILYVYPHRQNILLDGALHAVIADFGFVTPLPDSVGSTTVVTAAGAMSLAWSRGYLAPDISDGKHGTASDVYSYGVVSGFKDRIAVALAVYGVCPGCAGDIYGAVGLFGRARRWEAVKKKVMWIIVCRVFRWNTARS